MSVQTSAMDLDARTAAKALAAGELNPGDANSPSRPGKITTLVFLTALSSLLLYMNWKSVKGFLGTD
jgi:hypothetical protein